VSQPLLPWALACVRGWTRLYTSGLPIDARDRRRQEIESDLWEFVHDDGRGELAQAIAIFARLALGIPDDVGWRMEQHRIRRIAFRSVLALAAITVLLIGWIQQALEPPALPAVAPAPPLEILRVHVRMPPVPPPPPPLGREGVKDPEVSKRVRGLG
jgi:hypothetical protein